MKRVKIKAQIYYLAFILGLAWTEQMNKLFSLSITKFSLNSIFYFYVDSVCLSDHTFTELILEQAMQRMVFNKTYHRRLTNDFTKNSGLLRVSVLCTFSENFHFVNFVNTTWNLLMATDALSLIFARDSATVSLRYKTFHKNCSQASTETKECKAYLEYLHFPVLKIIIQFLKSLETETEILCNGFCSLSQTKVVPSTLDLSTKVKVLSNHKSFFKVGKNKPIPTFIGHAHWEIYEESKSKTFLCNQIYQARQYSNFSKALYCWAMQMIFIQLATEHNFTFDYWNDKSDIFTKNYISQDFRSNFRPEWYEGVHLQYISGWAYHYCVDKQHYSGPYWFTNNFKTWLRPVEPKVFQLIFICLTICSIFNACFEKNSEKLYWHWKKILQRFTEKFISAFHMLLRMTDIESQRGVIKSVVMIAGIIISLRYENELTSTVTVETAIKPFETMQEFLDAGFRMTLGEKYDKCGDVEDYGTKYYCVADRNLGYYDYVTRKLGWKRPARWNYWYFLKYNVDYRKEYGSSLYCFYVKEEVERVPWLLVMYTVNRYWMIKTVRRVHEGGLREKWNDWAQYAESNQNREQFLVKVENRKADVIGWGKLLPVLGFCVLLLMICLAVFGIECYSSKIKIIYENVVLSVNGLQEKFVTWQLQFTYGIYKNIMSF